MLNLGSYYSPEIKEHSNKTFSLLIPFFYLVPFGSCVSTLFSHVRPNDDSGIGSSRSHVQLCLGGFAARVRHTPFYPMLAFKRVATPLRCGTHFNPECMGRWNLTIMVVAVHPVYIGYTQDLRITQKSGRVPDVCNRIFCS